MWAYLGGGLQRKGSKDPPDIYIRKISRTHIEEAVQEDLPSQLGETQESDAIVTPNLTVQDTSQVPDKGHPVIEFGARSVASQGGMSVRTSPIAAASLGERGRCLRVAFM